MERDNICTGRTHRVENVGIIHVDGFGRELDPQNCTTGKSIPVCGLTELAGDFSVLRFWAPLKIPSVTYIHVGIPKFTCTYQLVMLLQLVAALAAGRNTR